MSIFTNSKSNGANTNTLSPDKQKEVQCDVLMLRHGAQPEISRKPGTPPQPNEEMFPQDDIIGRWVTTIPCPGEIGFVAPDEPIGSEAQVKSEGGRSNATNPGRFVRLISCGYQIEEMSRRKQQENTDNLVAFNESASTTTTPPPLTGFPAIISKIKEFFATKKQERLTIFPNPSLLEPIEPTKLPVVPDLPFMASRSFGQDATEAIEKIGQEEDGDRGVGLPKSKTSPNLRVGRGLGRVVNGWSKVNLKMGNGGS